MSTVKLEIELPKETVELAVGLGKFGLAVKTALADGWQMGSDLPVVITAAVAELVPAIQGFDQIDDEAKADPAGVGMAVLHGLGPIFKKA